MIMKKTNKQTNKQTKNKTKTKTRITKQTTEETGRQVKHVQFIPWKCKKRTDENLYVDITLHEKLDLLPFLIRIKDEVKYNNIFDNTFDAHQICDAFAYTFDSNQK